MGSAVVGFKKGRVERGNAWIQRVFKGSESLLPLNFCLKNRPATID